MTLVTLELATWQGGPRLVGKVNLANKFTVLGFEQMTFKLAEQKACHAFNF